jgi:DNA-binding transcriptional LysR family regulator
VELAQIEAFVEAQRRGSISRAAEGLGLAQPTVTARLRSLELELGVQLLSRGHRGVGLTSAGRRFLPRALTALDAVRRAAADARTSRDGRGGLLTVGLASDLALYLAPDALARFAKRYPDVEIHVRSGHSRLVADALRSDEVEIALVSQPVALTGLAARPLFDEALVPVAAAAHLLGNRKRVTVADLAAAGLVLRDPDALQHALTVTYFAQAGVGPRILMELDNTESCKRVVLTGLGVAFLPELAIRDELRRGSLVALEIAGRANPRRTIFVLTRSGTERSPGADALVGFMRPR